MAKLSELTKPARLAELAKIPEKAEIAIVGAGVIGLAIAFELTRRGQSVVVLERDRIGSGAAAAAAGMLAPVSEAEAEEPALVDLALESHRLYPEFVDAVESASGRACGFRREGTLVVALGRDEEGDLDHLRQAQEARGLTSVRLTADEVFDREPHLSGWVTGGLLAAEDHQVDPRALALALSGVVRGAGGRVVEGARVNGFGAEAGRLTHVTGQLSGTEFSVKCQTAVLAAGAWSSQDLGPDADELAVRPVKGQVVRLKGPQLVRHVVRTPEVYLVPRDSGELVVGATMEEQGFDSSPTAGAVMDLLRRAWHVLPGIYDCAISEISVGFRPATRDHLPLIGPTDVEGLLVATGHYRHGVLLAPVTARLIADLVTGGRESSLLGPFSPGRLHVRPH